MNNIQTRWFLGLGSSLLVALTGCDVSVGKCERDDAGDCVDLFPDDEDASTLDSGRADSGTPDSATSDGGVDGATSDGGSDSGTDAGVDAGEVGPAITVDTFCIAQLASAVAWRDEFEAFCSNQDIDWRESFLLYSLAYSDTSEDRCVTDRKASIASGAIVFDGTRAQACADAFAGQFARPPATFPAAGIDIAQYEAMTGHGAQTLVQLPICRAAFKGTLARDKPCTDSLECVAGLRCLTAVGDTRTCQPAVAPPGICLRTSDCADGHTCAGASGSKTCIPSNDLRLDGGGCALSAECVTGSVCNVTTSKCTPAVANVICTP